MATKKKLQLNGVDIVPQTTLDNIVLDVTASGYTTSIASGGKIKSDYMQSATGTTAGVIFNNDSARLTITSGGISVNAYTADISGATTTADKNKLPTVSAVQLYVGSYVSSNTLQCIPISSYTED